MSWLRVAWRLPTFALITLAAFVALASGNVLLLVAPGLRLRWRRQIFRLWARLIGALTGMDVRAEGGAPQRPFLLIANHLGYMDIVLLAIYLESVFVAKMEIAGWPLLGRVVRAADTIFVDRSQRKDVTRVNGEILRAMQRGDGVVVFAEGTSSGGDAVLPLRPSLLEVAAMQALPVHYARLSYRTPAGLPNARDAVCWWGDAPFFGHLIGLLRLPRFAALVHFGSEAVPAEDRKTLARVLHERISALPSLDASHQPSSEPT